MLPMPSFKALFRHMPNWGWMLPSLGIKGVGVICHGSSSPKAIKNAIRTARNFVKNHVRERLEEGLATAQSNGNQTN